MQIFISLSGACNKLIFYFNRKTHQIHIYVIISGSRTVNLLAFDSLTSVSHNNIFMLEILKMRKNVYSILEKDIPYHKIEKN